MSLADCSFGVDAQGIAAVRLDTGGRLEALAAGGLKLFKGGDISIELAERADVALWRDAADKWHGVLQGWDGPVPPPLQGLTADWLRLAVPLPLGETNKAGTQ
jgi:hypothetical protein